MLIYDDLIGPVTSVSDTPATSDSISDQKQSDNSRRGVNRESRDRQKNTEQKNQDDDVRLSINALLRLLESGVKQEILHDESDEAGDEPVTASLQRQNMIRAYERQRLSNSGDIKDKHQNSLFDQIIKLGIVEKKEIRIKLRYLRRSGIVTLPVVNELKQLQKLLTDMIKLHQK